MGRAAPQASSPSWMMCFNVNPFAQWCISDDSTTIPPISIFGALPQPYPPPPCSFIEFHFTSYNPTILNSVVVGPNAQPCYFISTDPSGFTVIQNRDGANVSFIEWQAHPLVEIQDRLPRQPVESWLAISRDQQSRVMDFRKTRYRWSTYNQHICLYADDTPIPSLRARISKVHGRVTLEVNDQELQIDSLEVFLTATLLLQCGRNID